MKLLLVIIAWAILSNSSNAFAQMKTNDSAKPSSFIGFCNTQKSKIEKSINLDWVNIDKGIIKEKINPLPAASSTLDEIKKVIPQFLEENNKSNTVTEDFGYGLKSTRHEISGGYGFFNVDIIHFGNDVLKLRIVINNKSEIIENYLLSVITLPFECINGQITYEKTYPKNLEKYIRDSGQLFLESLDTNYRKRQAINYFTDVLTGGTFTTPFYIRFGLGSETFNNLRFFIVNKDFQALENILFSPSPTSRLFAARTLLYLKEKSDYNPDNKVNQRITDIISNAKVIRSGILSCWVGKFDYDYYDIVKDFEILLKTQ